MKSKKRCTRLYLLILAGILTLTFGCEKIMFWKKEAPTVTTFPVTDITLDADGSEHHGAAGVYYTASSGGNVTDDGNKGVAFRGVVWSNHENPEVNIWKDELDHHQVEVVGEGGATIDGYGTGEFTSKLTFLEPETTYYLRAYAQNSEGIGYGEQVEFETLPLPIFTLTLVAEPEEGGTVEGGGEYDYNEVVTISASPNEGYQFENWTDEDGQEFSYHGHLFGSSRLIEFSMPAEDLTLTANFTEIPTYTLTLIAEPEEGGTVEGAGEYERWEYIDITATPNFGYEFVNWTDEDGDVFRTDASFSYQMQAEDVTFTANFRVPDGIAGTVTDVEGNVYNTIYIAGIEWMTENLRTTKYANNSDIPTGLSITEWEATTDGAYAVYPHDGVEGIESEQEMIDAYGLLYNWYTVETGNLCPAGWRVPSHDDFTTLERHVCTHDCDNKFPYDNHTTGRRGQDEARRLKNCRQVNSSQAGECATDEHPRWDGEWSHYGTDDYGFSALPAGLRHPEDDFGPSIGKSGVWWSSTDPTETVAWIRMINHNYSDVVREGSNKAYGFSVRCIRE